MKFTSQRVVLTCTGIMILLLVALSLLSLQPFSKTSEHSHAQIRASNSCQNTIAPAFIPPSVNAAAFKGQGRLAFVWQGLLYVLDGEAGEIGELTTGSVAMANSLGTRQFGPGKASQPAWSPDGEWLAFRYTSDAQPSADSLWFVRRDGRQCMGMPMSQAYGRFSWSPTGNTLAVAEDGGLWLFQVDGASLLDGTSRRLVPAASTGDSGSVPGDFSDSFDWSPDGKTLAYSFTLPYDSNHPEDRSDALFTIDINGGKPVKHLVAPQAGIELAGWWPNGKGLLYWLDGMHSASLAADGMPLCSLQFGNTEPKLLASGLGRQGWLSLGSQGELLMVAGGGRIVWADKSLAVINVESGSVRNLKNPTGSVAIDPSLSPDGRRIAFVAAKNLGDRIWGFDNPEDLTDWVASRTLWVENADGSGAHPLTSAGQGVYQPSWSKDGSHILYVKANSLWLIGAGGGEPEKICPLANEDPAAGAFGYYGFISYRDQMAWFQQ
jgi:TolB protein